MLYWITFLLSVLFGIDLAAEILGYGPLAYLGGAIAGAGFLLAAKKGAARQVSLGAPSDDGFGAGWSPAAPSEFRNIAAAHAGAAASENDARSRPARPANAPREQIADRRSSRSSPSRDAGRKRSRRTFWERLKHFLQL